MTNLTCFSDQYRTKNGREFFTFHFQKVDEDEWFFSFCRSHSSSLTSDAEFEVPEVRFKSETIDGLRVQAAQYAEAMQAFVSPSFTPHHHLPAK